MKKRYKLNLFLFAGCFIVIFGTLFAFIAGYDLSWLGTLMWVGAIFTVGVLASKS